MTTSRFFLLGLVTSYSRLVQQLCSAERFSSNQKVPLLMTSCSVTYGFFQDYSLAASVFRRNGPIHILPQGELKHAPKPPNSAPFFPGISLEERESSILE
jgi:hypothetical protein